MEALIDVRLCQALDLQAKGSECSLTTRRRVAERASPFKRRALERVVRLPHPACSTLRLSQIGNCSQFIFWPPPKLFTVVCGELNPALLATCEKLWTSYKRVGRSAKRQSQPTSGKPSPRRFTFLTARCLGSAGLNPRANANAPLRTGGRSRWAGRRTRCVGSFPRRRQAGWETGAPLTACRGAAVLASNGHLPPERSPSPRPSP